MLGGAAVLVTGCQTGAVLGDDETGFPDTGEPGPVVPELAFSADDLEQDDTRFPLAVQAGAMRPNSVLLTTWTPQTGQVLLRVWQPLDDGVVALWAEQLLEPDADGFLRVDVTGLAAGEWYQYAFMPVDSDGAPVSRSLVGRVRTALDEDALEPLTVALSACNGASNRPWPALLATAELDADLFCHLGDMAYNDGAQTLAEYRESWRDYLSGEGFRQAYARCGLYAVWDDHEFDNDWNPETLDAAQIDAAKQAYFEHVAAERASDGTVWRSYRWGRTAEFFLLDCRSERKPSTRTSDEAEYVSHAQLQWLLEALEASPCHFKVILNSVPITDMPLIWDAAAYDRWEGYRAQRDALVEALEQVDNVWFFSGDFHVCFVSTLARSPSTKAGAIHEIAVTGGHNNVLGDSLTIGSDQFAYATSRARAVTVRFDPEADEVEVSFVDPADGSVDWAQTLSYSNR
ncbi:MAG: hypothetical protein EP330_05915 [Deltaproteobacteria bacterium]|nr:MAG: hypothetical protein EP330_05915 [Deltaproteobacteria bacterium]